MNAHPIDRCRTLCARAFCQSPHDHMLFVDSDVVPPANCLDMMLAQDHPFVCGIAPIELADGLCSSVARKMGTDTYGFYRDFPDHPFETDVSGLSPLVHPGVLSSHRRRVDLRSIQSQMRSVASTS